MAVRVAVSLWHSVPSFAWAPEDSAKVREAWGP